jgi:hypothetical protein
MDFVDIRPVINYPREKASSAEDMEKELQIGSIVLTDLSTIPMSSVNNCEAFSKLSSQPHSMKRCGSMESFYNGSEVSSIHGSVHGYPSSFVYKYAGDNASVDGSVQSHFTSCDGSRLFIAPSVDSAADSIQRAKQEQAKMKRYPLRGVGRARKSFDFSIGKLPLRKDINRKVDLKDLQKLEFVAEGLHSDVYHATWQGEPVVVKVRLIF